MEPDWKDHPRVFVPVPRPLGPGPEVQQDLAGSAESRATSKASSPCQREFMGDTGATFSDPSASAAMTSSISSLKRNDPTSSSSRVMASDIRTGCGPEGRSPTITTRPPRTAPLMAEASPWWLPEDSITTSASTAAIASASAAARTAVGSDGTGYFQRLLVHVHGHDPRGAGTFQDGDGQGADGAAADHQRRLARHVPGPRDRVPGHAGRFDQRRGPQRRAFRKRAEHPRGQVHVAG